jgi:dihydrofolate synthase/folylpolyglutamate synthase
VPPYAAGVLPSETAGDDAGALAAVEAALAARWPEHRIAPSLDRIRDLCALLGDPQAAAPVVHIAGTNGKTSTARMIDALLSAFGLRTGRVTSPHLESVTERLSLDGNPAAPGVFVAAYEDVAPFLPIVDARHEHPLSYFEVLTAMAFSAFAEAPVGVAVVETGMGGTWDATNVADGAVAVVTTIGLDHQEYLGHDVATIAGEKAGIIKPGALAILAEQPPAALEVILRHADAVGATVVREGPDIGVRHREVAVGGQLLALAGQGGVYEDCFLPLHGAHQAHNAALALAAVEAFLGGGRAMLDLDVVQAGFAAVRSPGRLEVVRRSPTIVLDAAHNPAGATALAAAIEEAFAFDHLVGVVGVMADKDAEGLLAALEPVLAEVVLTASSSPRALPADALAAQAVPVFGADRVHVEPRLDDALEAAIGLLDDTGRTAGTGVLVTGSVVTAGEARRLLRGS